jgi:hypothetical protein
MQLSPQIELLMTVVQSKKTKNKNDYHLAICMPHCSKPKKAGPIAMILQTNIFLLEELNCYG